MVDRCGLMDRPRLRLIPAAVKLPLISASDTELEACYRFCETVALDRRHNYPVASIFLPSELRKYIWAVYAFVRMSDNIVDEDEFDGRRSHELDQWEQNLLEIYFGKTPTHPILIALADTIAKFQLPVTEFQRILSGVRSKLEEKNFTTFEELSGQVSLIAQPVGNLFLSIGGYQSPQLFKYMENLSIAVILTQRLQYLSENGGLHSLPKENVRFFGLEGFSKEDLRGKAELDALVELEVGRVRSFLLRSRPLIDLVGPDMAVELGLIWHGTGCVLDKVQKMGGEVMYRVPRLGYGDKAKVVSKSMKWRPDALKWRFLR